MKVFLFVQVPEHHTVLHSLHSFPVNCRRELKGGKKQHKVELMGWDKIIYWDRGKEKDNSYDECKSNCSPPSSQCAVSLLVVEEIDMNFHPLHNSFPNMSYGREYPFGQFQSAVLILFPLTSLGSQLRMTLALYSTA